jgi:DNA-binding NarL/FixJ family response regulator
MDRAMSAVLDGDVPPELAGNIYCHMIAGCWELADFKRARQWVAAAFDWLATLPAAVLFTGICRVHECQLALLQGDWAGALSGADRVSSDLDGISASTAAEAHYVAGDVHRLRGAPALAERRYRQAHSLGRDPQPGLALLRLGEGKIDAAVRMIATALVGETENRLARAGLCGAQVEIALTAGDLASARKASDELDDVARAFASPGLRAAALQARGMVLLALEQPAEALPVLRAAGQAWRDLRAPYELARTQQRLAAACRQLSDGDTAELELAAAERALRALGARDVRTGPARPAGLTEREVEVLSCLAIGRSNREIAAELTISQKTVSRHLANIFTKIEVSTRTAAAAYAFEHGLVDHVGRTPHTVR